MPDLSKKGQAASKIQSDSNASLSAGISQASSVEDPNQGLANKGNSVKNATKSKSKLKPGQSPQDSGFGHEDPEEDENAN